MDRVTAIEGALKAQLMTIDGTLQPDGYQYLSTVKRVGDHDEVVSVTAVNGGYPSILISQAPNETILSGNANAYRNSIGYVLKCRVSNGIGVKHPKRAIKIKMNELGQDIKHCLSVNNHLSDNCDTVQIVNLSRKYKTDGDVLRAGDLLVQVNIVYSQGRTRPDLNVCI